MSKHLLHSVNFLRKGTLAHDFGTEAIDLGVGAAASFGFGYLTGKYRDKTLIAGRVPLDLGVGVGLSALSIVAEAMGFLDGFAGLAKDVGRAGVSAWAHTHGVGAGTVARGEARAFVPQKDVAKLRAAVPNAVVGGIDPAPHGAFLSPDRLDQLSRA